jgi:hypothetical protein
MKKRPPPRLPRDPVQDDRADFPSIEPEPVAVALTDGDGEAAEQRRTSRSAASVGSDVIGRTHKHNNKRRQ